MDVRKAVIILEQKDGISNSLQQWLREQKYYLVNINRAEAIIPLIDSSDRIYTLVLVDDIALEGSFTENLKILKQLAPDVPIVTTTRYNNPKKEKEIRQLGTFYYHVNSAGIDELKSSILCALEEAMVKDRFLSFRPETKV